MQVKMEAVVCPFHLISSDLFSLPPKLCPEPSVTLLAGDNGAITAAMIANDTMLAIGTAGIEVAQQLFLNSKIKGKHVNLFD